MRCWWTAPWGLHCARDMLHLGHAHVAVVGRHGRRRVRSAVTRARATHRRRSSSRAPRPMSRAWSAKACPRSSATDGRPRARCIRPSRLAVPLFPMAVSAVAIGFGSAGGASRGYYVDPSFTPDGLPRQSPTRGPSPDSGVAGRHVAGPRHPGAVPPSRVAHPHARRSCVIGAGPCNSWGVGA